MALVWLALGIALAGLFFVDPFGFGTGAWLTGTAPAEVHAHETAEELWTCPMHPQVLREEFGSCPICGMDLVPVDTSDGGAPAAATHEHDAAELWTCPMHPEVLREEPGSCPICGMDLVPVDTGDGGAADAVAQEGQGTVVRIDPAVVQNMGVKTTPVSFRDLTKEIRTVGYLEYDQEKMVSVTTKFSGFIEKVYVNYVGQDVRKGEPLFEVYSPELVQTEQELLSALAYADELEGTSADAAARAHGLVDAARRRLEYWDISAEQIRRLEEQGEVFRTLTVTAPASGVVMKRMKGLEGMAIRPGMEALHIADLSTLWLTVEVFEDQLVWIEPGARAEVRLTYYPGETFNAKVLFVEPEVSEKSRSARLTLRVPNPDGRLRVGMYATVLFDPVAVADALAVPSEAVLRTGDRNVVVVALGEGRFAPQEVTLGREGEGYVQVLEGLEAADEVVTSAQFLIDSESNLRAAISQMIGGNATHQH
jgi:RND family efflux transporter MFP subunit